MISKLHPVVWCILITLGLIFSWPESDIRHGPGQIAKKIPQQTLLQDAQVFNFGDYQIHPQADFEIEARVLSRKNYRFDAGAELSPVDLALGWGAMSDETVLDQMDISQGARFFTWRVNEFPIPYEEIVNHSANMHMVPANKSIAKDLKRVKRGHVVRVRGKLVNISGENGWNWSSSLVRNDSGNGACELIWVESVQIL